jgi:hypothetical protein
MLAAVLAWLSGARVARAADGRELLASAIANTRGSYLVYNFGGGNPTPMLNAGGSGYGRRSPDDHQVGLTAADPLSRRLSPRLSGSLRTGFTGLDVRRALAGVRDLHPDPGLASIG